MPDILVRPATPGDIPAITAIYGQAVREGTASFEIEVPDEAEMWRRYEDLLAAGYPYLVAEHQGAILGYAYAGLYRARPAYRWTVEDSVYVDVAAQRRGVGRALLRGLIADSEARGFRQMIAVIGDTDERRLDRAAPRRRLPHGRDARERRLQVRPLAGQRADAAPARSRARRSPP